MPSAPASVAIWANSKSCSMRRCSCCLTCTHDALAKLSNTSPTVLEGRFIHLHSAENKRYARTVPIAESDVQAARRQLERVLASACFSRNERLARFLGFVV